MIEMSSEPGQTALREVTARSLLLDLLGASEPDAWPVKVLVEVASLFGISENALRVNTTRLLSRGMLEQDNRGFYRLAPTTGTIRHWVNRWSLGEERVVPWRGGWLSLTVDPALDARDLAKLERALHRLGLRRQMAGYWVRPNNLSGALADFLAQIATMGDSDHFVIAVADVVQGASGKLDLASLWDTRALEQLYRSQTERLENSLLALEKAPLDQVLRETFIYGGDVIHSLAQDPMLPEPMIDVSLRAALTDSMRKYDQTFRARWREHFGNDYLNSFPAGTG